MQGRQLYPFICLSLVLFACSQQPNQGSSSSAPVANDLAQIRERGELRVVTIVGAESYYLKGNDEMGKDFKLAENFANQLDIPMRVLVAADVEALKDSLLSGAADFAAWNVLCSHKNQEVVNFVDWEILSAPVLVQRKKHRLTKPTDLIGKHVVVKSKSKYLQRLKHLNQEIGGGILIDVAADSLSVDELINLVAKGKIDYTIADNDVALLSRKAFNNIDCSLELGVEMRKTWPVRKDAPVLLDSLNEWYQSIPKQSTSKNADIGRYLKGVPRPMADGAISPYDDLFQECAAVLGWDWRMLAAISYCESKFNCNVIASGGAVGLMQLMPSTARKMGLNNNTMLNPDSNCWAATRYLQRLNSKFANIENADERAKFVLASYNAGHGHIVDAIALTKKHGGNALLWEGNVERFFLLESEPQYYNDEVCRLGYYKAGHTVNYIDRVLAVYERFKGIK